MECIVIGQSVKIKRTDGRIHPAVVSKINEIAKSITVEWYERGETKGKEVELEAILALNPEILEGIPEVHLHQQQLQQQQLQQQQQHASLGETNKKHVNAPANLSRNPTHSAIGGSSGITSSIGPGSRTNRMTVHTTGINEMNHLSSFSSGTATNLNNISVATTMNNSNAVPTIPTALIRQRNLNAPTTSARLTSAGINTAIGSGAMDRLTAGANNGISNNVTATTGYQNNTNNVGANTTATTVTAGNGGGTGGNSTTTTAPTGATTGRRSYVVKEVERLKENREKRRARQAEIKEEKVALMNQDPGNPNWETAQMIREYQSTLEFNPLLDGQAVEDHQITVCVRKRPISRKESSRKEIDVISVPRKDMLIVHEPRNKVDLTKFLENHKFRFDYAFNENCDNAMVYKYTAKPLVKTIFEGGMATCFAYGQTGSGKTHTMGGEFNGKTQDCKNGIYAMAAKDVFALASSPRYRPLNLVVSASFFEIYGGKVFDLLSDKQKLRVLEDGKQQVQVVGLTEKVVDNVDEVLKLIQHGNNARTSGQTSANSNSSRSHAVFQILLRLRHASKIHGKFSFIDLAGNERGADTSSANRQTRMEGAEINKSLLALKECIRALGRQSSHLPFRVSKLTQVLRDSFIGEKSKTCMIAMISPGLSSCEHTLNTLRYADRVKELVVKDTPDNLRDGDIADVVEEEAEDNEEREEETHEHIDEDGHNQQQHHKQLQLQQQQQHQPKLQQKLSHQQRQHANRAATNNHHYNNNNNNKDGPGGEMDLALLCSLNEHDMSDELMVQHAAITEIQQTEEMVVDQHRSINEFLEQFIVESRALYNLTNYVDYDQDAYSKKGEAMFNQLVEVSTVCRDMMADYRNKLAKEEMLSFNFKAPKQAQNT